MAKIIEYLTKSLAKNPDKKSEVFKKIQQIKIQQKNKRKNHHTIEIFQKNLTFKKCSKIFEKYSQKSCKKISHIQNVPNIFENKTPQISRYFSKKKYIKNIRQNLT